MKISKVTLDKVPRLLRDGDVVAGHQFIMSLFPDEIDGNPRSKLNVLWRREVSSRGVLQYLVQSDQTPSLEHVRSSLKDSLTLEARDIEDLYASLLSDESFSYKVRVNPVVSQGHKRFPVRGQEDIASWWEQRLNRLGAQTVDDALLVDVEPLGRGVRQQKPLVVNSATIVGRATTSNPNLFLSTVREGLGKSRSYGYGLILLGR